MYGYAPVHYPAPRRGAGSKVLYLDFDGPLHHHEVYWHTARGPVLEAPQPCRLLQHVPLLEEALEPHPDVKIVLSTSWVKFYGFQGAARKLPESLRQRVIGATFHRAMDRREFEHLSRGYQILGDVARRAPAVWVALDDDVEGWPTQAIGNLIPVDGVLGLSAPATLEALRARLDSWHQPDHEVTTAPRGHDDDAA